MSTFEEEVEKEIRMNAFFIRVITVATVLICFGTIAYAEDAHRLTMGGRKLTAEEVESIEKQLEQNPHDTQLRTKLLGYYSGNQFRNPSARKARQRHILWLIVNSPETDVLGIPDGTLNVHLDRDAYIQGKEGWLDHIKQKPDDLKVLAHSANFFRMYDRELAIISLQKGQALDKDNPKWYRDLGHIYSLGIIRKSSEDKVIAAEKALEQFEIAYKLSTKSGQDALLQNLAKMALAANKTQKAKEYAEQMLNQNRAGWNYGNNIHHGNLILGRIALRSDDLEEAKKRLIKAGETPGSPQLNSFGPNMTLALELLKKGEKEVVLKYFELCLKFWKRGKDRIQKWSTDIENDELPNFRANLRY
jgi:tetratricopeptide (TPR) repeat protein